VDLDEDEDYDVDQMITQYQQKGGKVRGLFFISVYSIPLYILYT